MLKKTTMMAVLAFAATTTFAQNGNALQGRTIKKTPGKRLTAMMLPEGQVPTDYGTRENVLTEDFSKMTTGSLEQPDYETKINDYTLRPNAWENVLPEYTNQSIWGSHYVYPANGIAAMVPDDGYANLNTPMLDCSKYDGVAFVEMKVRTSDDTTADNLIVEGAETYDMKPSWKILEERYNPIDINGEWKTYTFMFYGAEKYTIFNFALSKKSQEDVVEPIFFDDVNVYIINPHVAMPTALPHTNYKGTTFTANWSGVEGADSYLLNVYAVQEGTGERTYLYENQSVTGTSFNVENAISGEVYYYDVQAVKGDKKSFLSPSIEVFDLEVPVLKDSEIKDGKYTAKWEEVPSAERYNYMETYERVAKADGEFVVTKEDFTGVTNAQGEFTGLTVENPGTNVYGSFFLKELTQAGWQLKNGMPYTDFVCVDGYQYIWNKEDAGLVSPELDLSKDGGKFKLNVKLYGVIGNLWDENGRPIPTQTQCAVALFNFNEEKGDYEQAQLIYPADVKEEWKDYELTFENGSKRSKIGIYAVKGPDNLYIDDLKITQNYKNGESLRDPFLFVRYHEGYELDVTLPGFTSGSKVYHALNAVKGGGKKTTAFCDYKYVGISDAVNGVENVNFSNAITVQVINDCIVVNNAEGKNVSVYGIDGTLVANDNSGKSIVSIKAARGTYVVKVGEKSVKLTF